MRIKSGPVAFATSLLLLFSMTACSSGSSKSMPSEVPLTKDAPAPTADDQSPDAAVPKHIDVTGFKNVIDTQNAVVLDVRTPQEYADGHIAKATNLDVTAPNFEDQVELLDKSLAYAVYCRSGNRSQTAAEILEKHGFKRVYGLDGGIQSWHQAGLPVVTGK